MVIQVAKAELRNLFYSPVAWFLLIAFIVQCAWFYTSPLFDLANWQDVYIRNKPDFKEWAGSSFTRRLFKDSGFFSNVLNNLYLFIPLLTMGLIGREVQNGTIKLLYSSPITIRKIVIGKFMAIMVFNLALVLVLGGFFLTASMNMINIDYGMLFSAALGFFLLTCAYAAIGAYLSSLTTWQIISALGSFLVIGLLTVIGGLWQQYDFVRDLTYFLFLSGRIEKMLAGLITSKDLIYFLAVISMFLLFTMLKLRGARELKPWYVKAARYAGVVAITLLTGYISSRPALTLYWDTTQQKVNTLHANTQQLIHEMKDEPLEVTLYTNFLGNEREAGMPKNRNAYLSRCWDKYLRFKTNIKFNYEYYYNYDSTVMKTKLYTYVNRGKTLEQIVNKMSQDQEIDISKFQKPAEMAKKIDLKPEHYRLVLQLKYKGRTEFVRTFDDKEIWPNEEGMAAVFKRLLHPEEIPLIQFTTGHYERSYDKGGERGYSIVGSKRSRGALVNRGFDLDTVSLDNRDISPRTSILVLADPKSELSETAREKIRNYIAKGGCMFMLGEPGKQQMMNPVISQLGVQLAEGTIVRANRHEIPTLVFSNAQAAFGGLVNHPEKPVTASISLDAQLVMDAAAAIVPSDTSNFTVTPLFKVSRGAWLKQGIIVTDSANVVFDEKGGDRSKVPSFMLPAHPAEDVYDKNDPHEHEDGHQSDSGFSTIVAFQRDINNKDQRILLAGDADFLSNKRSMQASRWGPHFFSWLDHGDYPLRVGRPAPPDNLLTITGKTARMINIIYVYVLPGAVLLFATILLIRRKRK
ncbi:Gldg family protein [Pseudobacter ginsenosidimutans]|nr:Gldg family protein [Pseudobacter ginsenosidimutans]